MGEELSHCVEAGNVYEDHASNPVTFVSIESMYVAEDGSVQLRIEENYGEPIKTTTHRTITFEDIRERILSDELTLRAV